MAACVVPARPHAHVSGHAMTCWNCWSDDPIDEPRIWSVKMRKRRADKIQTNQVAKKDKQRKIWRGKERGRESARGRLSESMSS